MLRVGLTGGTGAGKSTVAARLRQRGSVVVDADVLARQVVAVGTQGLAEVVREFGPGVLRPDGSLDRAALAAVVFADVDRRAALEAITHPRIAEQTNEIFAEAADDAVVVHDMPLLVEKRLGSGYHLVVVVDAPVTVRVGRLVASRGMNRSDAEARVRAQAGDADRRAAADVWLDNSADSGQADAGLLRAVDDLWDRRLVPFERCLRRRELPRPASRVTLVPHDPGWAATASRLLGRIATVTAGLVLRADHIGSTSVPGLAAKDVIDLQLVVPDLAAAATVGDAVGAVGLLRRDGRWWDELVDGGEHDKVLAASADPGRAVNLHVRELPSPAWRETVALRDLLRADAAEAAAYESLKRDAAAASPGDLQTYTRAKTAWIHAAVHRAREAGLWPP